MQSLNHLLRIIVYLTIGIVGMLCSGCAVFTFQNVETAPKGKVQCMLSAGATNTTDSLFYPDENATGRRTIATAQLRLRLGVKENWDIGFSWHGPWFPGIESKVRINRWLSLDMNLSCMLPVLDESPPVEPYGTLTMICNPYPLFRGNDKSYCGIRILSNGIYTGGYENSDPDLGFFAGTRFDLSRHISILPELNVYPITKTAGFGIGFLFGNHDDDV